MVSPRALSPLVVVDPRALDPLVVVNPRVLDPIAVVDPRMAFDLIELDAAFCRRSYLRQTPSSGASPSACMSLSRASSIACTSSSSTISSVIPSTLMSYFSVQESCHTARIIFFDEIDFPSQKDSFFSRALEIPRSVFRPPDLICHVCYPQVVQTSLHCQPQQPTIISHSIQSTVKSGSGGFCSLTNSLVLFRFLFLWTPRKAFAANLDTRKLSLGIAAPGGLDEAGGPSAPLLRVESEMRVEEGRFEADFGSRAQVKSSSPQKSPSFKRLRLKNPLRPPSVVTLSRRPRMRKIISSTGSPSRTM
ncbi:pantothenate synthetase [Striga asiatica]|uniref:Pantothenate synthetase n=1 Tax=Striga asiatica TaxID=4170 RepID=A0A5A7P4U3_STRAF|nr:pantothenate synthetase [Striga asiatica]